MKTLIIVILLLSIMPVCLAIQNPIDTAGDTIRKNTNNAVDDALSKVRQETHQIKKDIQQTIKVVLTGALEVFTVVAVCWLFSFLVDKSTARMVKFVAIVLGVNQFIKLFV
jgi:hypothetical protein